MPVSRLTKSLITIGMMRLIQKLDCSKATMALMLNNVISKSTMKTEGNGEFSMGQHSSANAKHIDPDTIRALCSGQTIGCEIGASKPEHKAWVEVIVLLDPSRGYKTRQNSTSSVEIISRTGENPTRGFLIRHIDIELDKVPYVWDYDELSTIYDEYEVNDQDELEQTLSRWVVDLSLVHVFKDAISEWVQSQPHEHQAEP